MNSRISEMAVVDQPFCFILVDIAYISRHIGAFYSLTGHIVSSGGMRFAAVRLD